MATLEACRAAIDRLAERLDSHTGGSVDLDRAISLDVTDLGTGFHGRLRNGKLTGITDGSDPNAKIKIAGRSDDLISMIDGKLNLAGAWASGQIKVEASMFDLIKLRSLM
ncbi:MAG: alkyl sulfatase C-terminal domain-containing protein [Micromonosporaceae bacterium]